MTDSLVARLREAIDETQRIAQAAQDKSPSPWKLDYYAAFMHGIVDGKGRALIPDDGLMESVNVRHIVRHDPAAVLRRCAADRKILDLHSPSEYRISYGGIPRTVLQCDHCASLCHSGSGLACDSPDAPYPCETVQIVAEAYGVEA